MGTTPQTIEAQRKVLDAVLASERLRRARRVPGVLAHLGDCYFRASPEPSSTDRIAEACFTDHHDLATLPNAVRQSVRNLKKLLGEYFEDEGRHHSYKIQIPSGPPYALRFEENPHASPRDCFGKFWSAYLQKQTKNLVLVTAPRFWRDGRHFYIRQIFCNSEDDRWKLEGIVGRELGCQLDPSFHYLSAGEAIGAMTLLRAFSLRHIPLDFDTDLQYQGLGQLDDCHIILIGSSRTSLLVRLLQPREAFTLTEHGVHLAGEQNDRYEDEIQSIPPDSADLRETRIKALAHEHWEKTGDPDCLNNWRWAVEEYKRQKSMEPHLANKYAILTRMPSPHQGHVITMIAANHGRAAQGVVEFLTNQTKLQTLFEWMKTEPTAPMPLRFQIVFGVTVSRLNGEGAPETVTPLEWLDEQIPKKLVAAASMPSESMLKSVG